VREDFQQVGRSAVWEQLRRIGSAHIDQLAAALATMLQRHPMKVSNLDSVLQNLASFKFPTSTPASTPPAPPQRSAPKPAPKPASKSTPAVPSWMKGSGYRNSDG
jgi:hypothetical protein